MKKLFLLISILIRLILELLGFGEKTEDDYEKYKNGYEEMEGK